MAERERERERKRERALWSLTLLIRAPTTSWGLHPHDLPRASPSNTITLVVKISAHEFWGNTNMQSKTVSQEPHTDLDHFPRSQHEWCPLELYDMVAHLISTQILVE